MPLIFLSVFFRIFDVPDFYVVLYAIAFSLFSFTLTGLQFAKWYITYKNIEKSSDVKDIALKLIHKKSRISGRLGYFAFITCFLFGTIIWCLFGYALFSADTHTVSVIVNYCLLLFISFVGSLFYVLAAIFLMIKRIHARIY